MGQSHILGLGRTPFPPPPPPQPIGIPRPQIPPQYFGPVTMPASPLFPSEDFPVSALHSVLTPDPFSAVHHPKPRPSEEPLAPVFRDRSEPPPTVSVPSPSAGHLPSVSIPRFSEPDRATSFHPVQPPVEPLPLPRALAQPAHPPRRQSPPPPQSLPKPIAAVKLPWPEPALELLPPPLPVAAAKLPWPKPSSQPPPRPKPIAAVKPPTPTPAPTPPPAMAHQTPKRGSISAMSLQPRGTSVVPVSRSPYTQPPPPIPSRPMPVPLTPQTPSSVPSQGSSSKSRPLPARGPGPMLEPLGSSGQTLAARFAGGSTAASRSRSTGGSVSTVPPPRRKSISVMDFTRLSALPAASMTPGPRFPVSVIRRDEDPCRPRSYSCAPLPSSTFKSPGVLPVPAPSAETDTSMSVLNLSLHLSMEQDLVPQRVKWDG
eukprot:RCo036494